MRFYETLSPYYNQIFPSNDKQLSFIASYIKEGGKILDIGAGTGNIADSLADQGYFVTATEPEATLATQISDKALSNGQLQVRFESMQEIDQIPELYDGIYCIGNTLVHLNSLTEIKKLMLSVYEKLANNGTFIIQIVNYEKVLSADFSFPLVTKPEFTFERNYELLDDKIAFSCKITTANGSEENTVILFPATEQQLTPMLKKIGYKDIQCFGNFEKTPYTEASPALVIVAIK